jgi:predicted nucleic acid-binding protein
MSLVLDSSVTLAWLYTEETTVAVQRVMDLVVGSTAYVPAIWRLEVANSLQTGIRRGRIDAVFRDASLADLALMDIATDTETDTYAWNTTLRLAERFKLTVYDAAYLELAQRRSLPLASLDHDLRAAAASLGITLLGA